MNQETRKGTRRRWPWFLATAGSLIFSSILVLVVFISQYDFNRLKPVLAALVKEKTGRDLMIHGHITFETGLTPRLIVEQVALQNAPWGTAPDMVSAKRLELEIALLPLVRKSLQVKKAILSEPRVLIETDPSGRSNLPFQSATKASPRGGTEALSLSLGRLGVERGSFCYKDRKRGKIFSLTVDHLQAQRAAAGDRIELEVRGVYASRPYELKGWVGTMASLMAPMEPWGIDVTARAFDAQMRLSGFVRSFKSVEGVSLKIQSAGRSLGRIGESFGWSRMPELGPFKIECDLSGEKDKTYRLSRIKFSNKAVRGEGDLQVSLKGPRPEMRGWLSCEKVDLGTLLKMGVHQKQANTGREKKKKVFPSKPLPLQSLERMTGEVEITVDKVILPHSALGGFKTKLCAAEGRFTVKSLKLKAGGGEIEGALDIKRDGRALSIAAQAKVNQADLHLFLGETRAQGKVEAEIDVTARGTWGASMASLMGGLNGRILFAVRGFSVENKYLKLLGSDFITDLSQVFASPSEQASSTEINCLVSGLNITGGLGRVTVMIADTNDMMVVGQGQVNLKEERLNLTISPYPKKGVAGLSLSFSGITRAFKVGGTFAEPSVAMDPLQTALTLGKVVGGVFLVGPAGAVLAFAGQTAGEGDVCTAAMEAAREAGKTTEEKTGDQASRRDGQKNGGLKETLHSVTESVGKLFKKLSSQPRTPVDASGEVR